VEQIVVGRIRRPHGLAGGFRLKLETDAPEEVFTAGRVFQVVPGPPDGGHERLTLRTAHRHGRSWLAEFMEVTARSEAERYTGLSLALPRDQLAEPGEGEFFFHELVGLEVCGRDGVPVGVVSDVYEAHGKVLLGVCMESHERLIPFDAHVVKEVDRTAGRIWIEPPRGLLEI